MKQDFIEKLPPDAQKEYTPGVSSGLPPSGGRDYIGNSEYIDSFVYKLLLLNLLYLIYI